MKRLSPAAELVLGFVRQRLGQCSELDCIRLIFALLDLLRDEIERKRRS